MFFFSANLCFFPLVYLCTAFADLPWKGCCPECSGRHFWCIFGSEVYGVALVSNCCLLCQVECFLRGPGVHSLELLSNGCPTLNVVFCWAAVKWKGAGLHLVWLQLCWSDCELSPVKPAFIEDLNGWCI
ncbi:unnamed protein product [Camellia sinensis]